MIKPTVGRVVLYWPAPTDSIFGNDGSGPVPALICHVHHESCVNLACFDAHGNHFAKTSVPLYQDGQPRPASGFAEWMVYQKQVAAGEIPPMKHA